MACICTDYISCTDLNIPVSNFSLLGLGGLPWICTQIVSFCSVSSRHFKHGCIFFIRHSKFLKTEIFLFIYVFLEMTCLEKKKGEKGKKGLPWTTGIIFLIFQHVNCGPRSSYTFGPRPLSSTTFYIDEHIFDR